MAASTSSECKQSTEESDVNQVSCDTLHLERDVNPRHVRHRLKFRKRKINASTPSSSEPQEDSDRVVPSSTSMWSMPCLESLGIHYDTHSKPSTVDILDMVYREIGVFKPLSKEQKDQVQRLQDSITFSFYMTDILKRRSDLNRKGQELKEEMKANIMHLLSPADSITVEFINSLILIVKYQVAYAQGDRYGPVPDEMFTDMFKLFVRMCRLIPISGKAWKSSLKINKISVSSETDLVVLPDSYLDEAKETVSIASIVKVKSFYKESDHQKPMLRSSSSNQFLDNVSSVHTEPNIFQRIDKNILGQHGGELLIHHKLNKDLIEGRDFKCVPGMIVNGTEVTLTLLVINPFHLSDVLRGNTIKDGSFIYYSEPRDLLNKNDRDLLIESFARLNNV